MHDISWYIMIYHDINLVTFSSWNTQSKLTLLITTVSGWDFTTVWNKLGGRIFQDRISAEENGHRWRGWLLHPCALLRDAMLGYIGCIRWILNPWHPLTSMSYVLIWYKIASNSVISIGRTKMICLSDLTVVCQNLRALLVCSWFPTKNHPLSWD